MTENIHNPFPKDRLICILGAGESGIGAALLAKQQGYDVFVSEGGKIKENFRSELLEAGISFEEGQHSTGKILSAQLVIKSPGIPEENALVKKLRAENIPVISEIEWAFYFTGGSKIIGITGSNGKSTTTSLIYHICKTGGVDCAMVGNIGISFARQVAVDPKPLYVVEISSFQLDDIKQFRASIALLLNITEDHLDRYDHDMRKYAESKFRITENQQQDDYFIYCPDDPVTMENLSKYKTKAKLLPFTMKQHPQQGAYITGDTLTIKVSNEILEMSVYDFAIKGKHNQYNSMVAGLTAMVVGIRKSSIRDALSSFRGLPHRMENVATVRGVNFINDSKATNVNSTWYSLECMDRPVVLIMGGFDKGNDYEILKDLIREKVKAIVCLGIDNEKIHSELGCLVPFITDTLSAEEAVKTSFQLASKGDVVLLSPACASFDLFKNFEDRGTQFRDAVLAL